MPSPNAVNRHIARREPRVGAHINFCLRSYEALTTIKQAICAATGITYSNAVVCRAIALELAASITASNRELINRLARCAANCASQGPQAKKKGAKQ